MTFPTCCLHAGQAQVLPWPAMPRMATHAPLSEFICNKFNGFHKITHRGIFAMVGPSGCNSTFSSLLVSPESFSEFKADFSGADPTADELTARSLHLHIHIQRFFSAVSSAI